MRIWLAGSRSFGAAVFTEIHGNHNLEVVGVTAPLEADDALGKAALEQGIPVFDYLDSQLVCHSLVDVIVSAHNLKHMSSVSRCVAKFGAIGYHPSWLPKHRGKNSVEDTIQANDLIAGGTVYLLDNGFDTGPIIRQEWCHVRHGWTASDLWRRELFPMGVRLLSAVLRAGPPWPLREQDEMVSENAD